MTERLEASPPTFDLRLLGPVELHAPPGESSDELQCHVKTLAVLVFIAVEGNGSAVSRERIASLFWPESDEKRARGALRQALRVIRRCLGPDALIANGRGYVEVSTETICCDVSKFETLLDAGSTEDALELYRGDFASDFHITGGHQWDDWLEVRRVRYRSKASAAAWTLAEDAERAGDVADTAYWAKRALGYQPRNELAVRRLMRVLDRIGDGAGAIRAYCGLEEWLADELGMPPSAETRELARTIRDRAEVSTQVPTARRQRPDRRVVGERRRTKGVPPGRERRRGGDRRSRDERRSGRDRRRLGG